MKNKISIFIQWLLVPILLIIFWIVAPVILQSPFSFTTLSFQDKTPLVVQKLQAQKPIQGSFVSQEDNLGAVEFMLDNINTYQGVVNFKIKEKNSVNWFYESNFKTVLIGRNSLTPYGFPIIANSFGKTYEFSLTLLHPNSDGVLTISNVSPQFLSIYKFDKDYLLHHPNELKNFLYGKISTTYSYPNFFFYSLRYLLPFIFYFFWQFGGKRLISLKYKFLGIFFGVSIIYIVLSATLDGYLIIFVTPTIWFVLMKRYLFTSLQTFYWSFLFLAAASVCLILFQWQMAINAGDIFYGLFLYGIIQRLFEQGIFKIQFFKRK